MHVLQSVQVSLGEFLAKGVPLPAVPTSRAKEDEERAFREWMEQDSGTSGGGTPASDSTSGALASSAPSSEVGVGGGVGGGSLAGALEHASPECVEAWSHLSEQFGEFICGTVLEDCGWDVEQAVAVLQVRQGCWERHDVCIACWACLTVQALPLYHLCTLLRQM